MTLDRLPAVDRTPLPPPAGEWQRITGIARRRRRRRTTATTALVALAVAAPLALLWPDTNRPDRVNPAPAVAAIAGLKTHDARDLSRRHVEGPVDYPQTPPVGGDHAGQPQQCGTYSAPVRTENAVHSLEHGAVWITYRPGLPSSGVQQLERLAAGIEPWALLSPLPEQADPVVITAWGVQLATSDPADPRLKTFAVRYANGPQAPEPDAPCTGTTATAADIG